MITTKIIFNITNRERRDFVPKLLQTLNIPLTGRPQHSCVITV